MSEAKDLLREAEVGSSDRQSALIARPDGECELLSPRAPPTKARCTKDAEVLGFADDDNAPQPGASDGNQIGFFLTEQ